MYAALVDYGFHVRTPPPPDYPAGPVPDEYAAEPFAPKFADRRQAFLDHVLRNPGPANLKAPFHEMARLAAGGMPHEGIFYAALDYIDERKDCADFVLHAVLRLLLQFSDRLEPALLDRARQTVLAFKYWPDEAGPGQAGYASRCRDERLQARLDATATLLPRLHRDLGRR